MKTLLPFLCASCLCLPRRESLSNDAGSDAGERENAVANSADEPLDEIDGWFKISPFGVFPGRTPARPQHFGQEQAQAIEEEFNSVMGKVKRWGRGIPIYRGHPDVDPETWPDDRRIGKLTQLDVRADGLWGYAEWNALGRENKEQEFWIYPSPRWDAPKGQARFAPDRLISVGLTNNPRIKESDPVFNSDEPPTNTTIMDRTALCQALGLPPEATDEEILAKITALQSAAATAETNVTEANTAKETAETAMAEEKRLKEEAENSATTARTAHDKLLLDGAERDGRITKAERAGYETKLAGDKREETINGIGALKPKLNTKALEERQGSDSRAASNEEREQVANAVAELQRTKGLTYIAAWNEAKKDERFATFFARVEA